MYVLLFAKNYSLKLASTNIVATNSAILSLNNEMRSIEFRGNLHAFQQQTLCTILSLLNLDNFLCMFGYLFCGKLYLYYFLFLWTCHLFSSLTCWFQMCTLLILVIVEVDFRLFVVAVVLGFVVFALVVVHSCDWAQFVFTNEFNLAFWQAICKKRIENRKAQKP